MTGPIENNNDSKTKLPEVFLENFHNVKKQAQHVLKLLGDLVTIEDFETKMQKLCLDVYEEWRHADSFNPSQLYLTILRHYSHSHIQFAKLQAGEQYLYSVHVGNSSLFRSSSIVDALIFFWCIIFVGRVECPRNILLLHQVGPVRNVRINAQPQDTMCRSAFKPQNRYRATIVNASCKSSYIIVHVCRSDIE